MSSEMKRLLKCDLKYSIRQMVTGIGMTCLLVLWLYITVDELINVLLVFVAIKGVYLMMQSVDDWKSRNSLYISMGMNRKNVAKIIIGRGVIWILVDIVIEAIIGMTLYPNAFSVGFLLLSFSYFMICHGYGQFSSVLAYQKKKGGAFLQSLGMCIGGFFIGCSAFFILEILEKNYEFEIFSFISQLNLFPVILPAVFIWGLGMYHAWKQMKEFAVL